MRHHDWATRLDKYVQSVSAQTFSYGQFDCGIFASSCIDAITGIDPAAPLRGKYESRKGCLQAIKALCGKASIRALAVYMAEQHGWVEVEPAFTQRGDLVVMRNRLGIISLSGTDVYVPSKQGIVRLPRAHAGITSAYHIS
jgi:hypothetical protein